MSAIPPDGFATPVALCLYNRPQFVRQLIAALRQVRPRLVLVFADAAKPDRPDDDRRCLEARAAVDEIDWPCDVRWNIAAANLGARRRWESGLDWVFGQVEEAVLFEDDCIPDPTFFRYCRELLARYRDDPAVLVVSGMTEPADRGPWTSESYRFSIYPHFYGWATWRRTWSLYESHLESWPSLRATDWLERLVGDRRTVRLWTQRFDLVHRGLDAWDYGLVFACWKARGLAARPRLDMVQNVGFGPDATNTLNPDAVFAHRPAGPMPFPLVHPARAPDWRTARDTVRSASRPAARDALAERWHDLQRTMAARFGPAGRSGRLRRIFRSRNLPSASTLPPVGTSLTFRNPAAAGALVAGWSFPEAKGRWSVGMKTVIAWRIDRALTDDVICEVRAAPALHPSQPGMYVDVFVNDRLCAASVYGFDAREARIPASLDTIDRFRIPREILTDQTAMVMTFFVRWPFIPAAHDESDDIRPLGLFFESVAFEGLDR